MKANTYDASGKKKASVELPAVFKTAYRPGIISRAFWAEQVFQPKGNDPKAGFKTSAQNWGTGAGRSRIPRVKAGPFRSGRGAKGNWYRSKGRWFPAAGVPRIVPQARKGREAHPPKSWADKTKKINKKEAVFALASAVAATMSKELIEARGHRTGKLDSFPIIAEDLGMSKTKDALAFLAGLGLEEELERIAEAKIRAGKGTKRGRKYKIKTGPLVVLAKGSKTKAFNNLRGVDAVTTDKLKITHLAPGATAGRLAVFEKKALEELHGSI